MSNECLLPEEELCGCCAGVEQETPQAIANRAALSSVSYRVGTYSTFNASMLAALSDPEYPLLGLLRTRDTSDFTIALLDAWAVTLDVLTFYQERFANEAFLRTAVDQRSVFELARLVGYVPSPGVAASAVLAFTLMSATGSPDTVPIPAGTRVQSVPGPGETPQTFETTQDLNALIALNALPVQTTIPWQLAGGDTSAWIAGTANNINVGDVLLFLTAQNGLPVTNGPADVHYVTTAVADTASGNTAVSWDQPLSPVFAAGATANDVCVYIFRKKAALYGVQAPNPLSLGSTTSNPNLGNIPGYPSTVGPGSDWSFIYDENSNQIHLDASYAGLAPQSGTPQFVILTGLGYTSYFTVSAVSESNPNRYTVTTKTTQLTLGLGSILAGDPYLSLNSLLWEFVQETRNITAYVQSVQLSLPDIPLTATSIGGVSIASGMNLPVQGSSITLVGGQQVASSQPIGVSGRRARLQVQVGDQAVFIPESSDAALDVTDNQFFLIDSYPPSVDPVTALPAWSVITIAGIAGTLVAAATNVQLAPSVKQDAIVSEAAQVNGVIVSGDLTTLSLLAPLTRIYDAPTVAVNANAVEATNGETVQEILGSGDAGNNALQFTLKQAPLTYITSPSGNGSQSTLEVWVNNLRWQEVSNLLSSGPADRVYVTRANAQGKTVIQFGNGSQGAIPPTGQANIRAVYRKGIGLGGMVDAGQLSQPIDRPQGLNKVSNPSAASGAADPATPADARVSAPMPTLTIGRVVSLEDYQNFALAFAGIAKALATWTWFGNIRGVFLSIAGENGATFQKSDPVVTNLVKALQSSGNPYVPLQVASYDPVLFEFAANVNIDQGQYDPKLVLDQVWQNVASTFAFQQRGLAQNVAASEVIAVLQDTPGVVAVQLKSLSLSGQPLSAAVPTQLCASGPLPPQGAQMLMLDPQTRGNIGVWS